MHQYEKLVLSALEKSPVASLAELEILSGLKADSAMRASYWLQEKGFVKITEEKSESYALTEEGERFLSDGFPERKLLEKDGAALSSLSGEEKRIGISWARKLGWIEISQEKIKLTLGGKQARKQKYLESVLAQVKEGKIPEDEKARNLCGRGSLKVVEKKSFTIELTENGRKVLSEISETSENEVNLLTKDLIVSGKWKSTNLRPYDISAPSEIAQIGKKHPLQIAIEKISKIFLEMGFEQMTGPSSESSFWNFDALFQPQDHPARELADTFYLSNPNKIDLPHKKIVERVKQAHENGWKYEWNPELAKQPVLRTHTTAVSARYVSDTGEGKRNTPARYFSIGKVYRNEAIDYKHLAEFYQVEGIVVWEKATFCDLLGCLKEFYMKLGFEKIRFMPSYFPYTEPSLEVEVFFPERKQWLELGGAGIFRPEVCLPLWGKFPVLAWGLSLERPVMLRLGLADIRTPYKNNLGWLRETELNSFNP